MAIKDVKHYYYTMQAQYLEMKTDLADFEQALTDGFITDDQLQAARDEVTRLENNYDRLSYIMYLLELPNRPEKKAKHARASAGVLKYLTGQNATTEAVYMENVSALDHLRKELKQLKVDN